MRYVIMNSDGEVYNEADDVFICELDDATIYSIWEAAATVKRELRANGYTDARVYPAVIIGK